MGFRVIIIGGTGQVGAAVIRGLLADANCLEVVMINRREASIEPGPRLRQVVLDTAASDFESRVQALAEELVALGDRVCAASCVGVGAGSAKWSEEALVALEVGVVGAFARGCHGAGIQHFALLSAVGSDTNSRVRYSRVMGKKEDGLRAVGFARLALFRPGIIAGNVHTPKWVEWLGRLIPGRYGNIDQDVMGRAFAVELAMPEPEPGVVAYENGDMRELVRGA